MKEPSWTDGGADMPTLAGVLLSYLAAPFGGLGVTIALFGAWLPAALFAISGAAMWFTGRWLVDR